MAESVRRLATALAVATLLLTGCGSGGGTSAKTPTTYVKLDGSARVPAAEGTVEALPDDLKTITLDGGRVYKVSVAVQNFSTIDGSTVPLKNRVGQYVQVGLRGDTAVWIATIADVVTTSDGPVVYYTGTLVKQIGKRLTFKDGTVLTLGSGVKVPDGAMHVVVTLDPKQHVVTSVTNG